MKKIAHSNAIPPSRVFLGLTLALITSLGLLACSGASGPTPTARVLEVEKSPGSLTVYMGRGETLIGPIIEQFETLTGIKVAVKYASTTQLAATLQEEYDKDYPERRKGG